MSTEAARLLQEGIAAFKAGRKVEARQLLTRATELDERNENAWLWLSAVVDSLENQQICLENVLALNPNNTRALKGLEAVTKKLARQQQSQAAKPAPPPPSVVPPHVSPFDMNMPAPSFTVPPADTPYSPSPRDAEGGYHGSGKQVELPSAAEYDNWLDSLKLERGRQPASDPFELSTGPFQQNIDFAGEGNAPAVSPFGNMVSPGYEEGEAEAYVGDARVDPFDLSQASAPSYVPTYPDEDETDPLAGMTGEYSSASPFGDFDDGVQVADDLIRYFDSIPAEIKATHLPGAGSLYPRGVLVSLMVVGVGIATALIVLVIQLVS